jgi:polysaccharide biosynthesis transport protein
METLMPANKNLLASGNDAQGYANSAFIPPPQLDIRRIWRALLNRKLMILLVAASILGGVALYSFLIPTTYQSTVTVQVDPEAVKVLPYTSVSDSLVSAPADFELYMKTQDEILRSPSSLARVVERIQEKYKNPNLLMLKGDFESGMSTYRIQGSQIVKISYESYDPDFSALAANSIAEEFIKLHFERKVETTRKASEFLQNQLRTLKEKVEKSEAEVIRYAAKHNIVDASTNQENVIRQRLSLLNSQVADAEKELVSRRTANEAMQKVTVDAFLSRLRTPEIAALETGVYKAEQELATLLVQFGENWPQVVSKRQEIAILKQQLLDQKAEIIAQEKRDAETHYRTALNQYNSLNQTLKEQQELVNQLNEASIQYNTLKRDSDAGELIYQGLLQRMKETGISAALEFGNIRIIDKALPARMPYRPRIAWNLALGLLLGLSAGIALAFFTEYMDSSVKNLTDVEAMGIPLLGWVPALRLEKGGKKTARGQLPGNGSSLQLSSPSDAHPAVQQPHLRSWDLRVRESYRSMVASLLLSSPGEPARTILITSAVPKEGKTTTLKNLGKILAETGATTLLIDLDFRRASLTHQFGITNQRGLSVHLAGGGIDICKTDHPNLFVIPAGPLPPNPVALFSSNGFPETLTVLRKTFQFILLDSAPMLSVAETSLISSKVDGVILVIRAGETPREIVSRAHMQLIRSGAKVLGAAVTDVNLKNAEYHYYNKYYYDREYSQKVESEDPPITS